MGCSAGNNRVVRRETIGLLPGSTNFCQCFIGYLPCGWQLGKAGCFPAQRAVIVCYFTQNKNRVMVMVLNTTFNNISAIFIIDSHSDVQ
jgi:hypothetical protein